jgi:hypothetical protein
MRQQDPKFKASLGNIVRPCPKTMQKAWDLLTPAPTLRGDWGMNPQPQMDTTLPLRPSEAVLHIAPAQSRVHSLLFYNCTFKCHSRMKLVLKVSTADSGTGSPRWGVHWVSQADSGAQGHFQEVPGGGHLYILESQLLQPASGLVLAGLSDPRLHQEVEEIRQATRGRCPVLVQDRFCQQEASSCCRCTGMSSEWTPRVTHKGQGAGEGDKDVRTRGWWWGTER